MFRRALIGFALCLPALTACGDDAPSKEDFLAEADPVCKRGNDIAAVFTTPSDVPMMKDFGTKLADNVTKTADEVDKLDKPGGEDGKAAVEMVKAMRDAAGAARAVGPEVDAANYPGVEAAVIKTVDAFKNADGKARAFGSAECGKGEAAAAAKLGETSAATVKKAYITKVDGVCATYNKQLEGLAEPESLAELKAYLDQLTGLAEKLFAEWKAIAAPTVDKAKLDETFAANDAVLNKIKEASAAAAAKDERKTLALTDETFALGDAANAKADAYGFKDCGSEGA